MSQDMVGVTDDSMALSEGVLALLGSIAGGILIAEKEKALAGIGLATFSLLLLIDSYTYLIPHYFPPLSQPKLLHGLSAVLISFIGVMAVYKLASVAIYLLLVALTVPLTYQLMSILWELDPAKEWNQAKLFVSLLFGVVLSTIAVEHLERTSKFASVVLGGLLIAASVQYLCEDESYLGGIEKCLGSPKGGWDASECIPFYFTWLGVMFATGILSLLSLVSKERRSATPREVVIHTEEAPYFRLDEPPPSRGVWDRIKSGGRSVKDFLAEKFTEAPLLANEPTHPHQQERVP